MAEYTSGSVYFSGLGNGTNFDTMITQLKTLEEMPAKKLLKWKKDWQIRLDAFGEIRSKLASFSSFMAGISTESNFMAKNGVSSMSTVAGVKTSSGAMDGTYNVQVGRLATTSQCTLQTNFSDKFAVVNNTGADQQFKFNYKGTDYTYNIPTGTNVEGLKNIVNNTGQNPGVKATLVSSAQGMIFQLTATESGSGATIIMDPSTRVGGFGTPGNASVSLDTNLTASSIVNNTSSVQSFTYKYNGTNYSCLLDPGATLQNLVDKVNGSGTGVTASLAAGSGGGETLKLTSNTVGPGSISIDPLSMVGTYQGQSSSYASQTLHTTYASGSTIINSSSAAETFTYSHNGTSYDINIPAGMTLNGFVDAFNSSAGANGLNATLQAGTGGMDLKITSNTAGSGETIAMGQLDSYTPASWNTVSGISGWSSTPGAGWLTTTGQNGQIKVNGWPSGADEWLEVKSNTVNDVIDGVTVNLYSVGMTTVTVETDKAKIKENIVEFVNQVNEVRQLFKTLTKVDGNKVTYDPEDSENQYESQKGSVLTGNYGIQMMESKLKTVIMDKGKGFGYSEKNAAGNIISGDEFSSLAQLGIYTDSKEGSATFGLLLFETDSSKMTLDKALEKDVQGVADLFSADLKPDVDSNQFGVESVMKSFTKAGEYEVKYEVDGTGQITSATINGKAAIVNNNTKQIFLDKYRNPDGSSAVANDADGIMLNIYDLTPGSHPPAGEKPGLVRVKQGKLGQLKSMIDVEMLEPDGGDDDPVKGTLSILETQYKKIMSNIDDKVIRESDRIVKWERLTRLRFARLEATLNTYDNLAKQIESQVAQLSSSSS